jgi:hypothetical protein
VILEPVLDVTEELEDVQSVDTCVQEGVHALEGSLAKVKSVIYLVFKRSHLNLKKSNKRCVMMNFEITN